MRATPEYKRDHYIAPRTQSQRFRDTPWAHEAKDWGREIVPALLMIVAVAALITVATRLAHQSVDAGIHRHAECHGWSGGKC